MEFHNKQAEGWSTLGASSLPSVSFCRGQSQGRSKEKRKSPGEEPKLG
jgi:hypothetical protein